MRPEDLPYDGDELVALARCELEMASHTSETFKEAEQLSAATSHWGEESDRYRELLESVHALLQFFPRGWWREDEDVDFIEEPNT